MVKHINNTVKKLGDTFSYIINQTNGSFCGTIMVLEEGGDIKWKKCINLSIR